MIKLFPASRFKNAKILVVDDLAFNVKLICAKLTASGYVNLETAADGEEAIEVTHSTKPDIVLLDLMMPVMDGYGYLQAIRGDMSFINMPIIVQTALDDRQTKLKSLGSGADDFLNKPLDLEELALRVHIHLERRFILEDKNHLQTELNKELHCANETIRKLESRMSLEERNLLIKHHDTIKSMIMPPVEQKIMNS